MSIEPQLSTASYASLCFVTERSSIVATVSLKRAANIHATPSLAVVTTAQSITNATAARRRKERFRTRAGGGGTTGGAAATSATPTPAVSADMGSAGTGSVGGTTSRARGVVAGE